MDQKYPTLLRKYRSYAVHHQGSDMISVDYLDKTTIPILEQHAKVALDLGESSIAQCKDDQRKYWPASKYKLKTQWITSLITSGAAPGWQVG